MSFSILNSLWRENKERRKKRSGSGVALSLPKICYQCLAICYRQVICIYKSRDNGNNVSRSRKCTYDIKIFITYYAKDRTRFYFCINTKKHDVNQFSNAICKSQWFVFSFVVCTFVRVNISYIAFCCKRLYKRFSSCYKCKYAFTYNNEE